MKYDYLLVVGPGRSGSEFLYRILKSHTAFAFPEIKEGMYYRSPKAFKRVWQELQGEQRKLLCDIENSAYRDPALFPGAAVLRERGVKALLMVLIRDHQDRALSMMKFRKSRGQPSALFGDRRLEQSVVRDRLTPKRLWDIFRIEADILTIYFPALTQDTAAVLDVLAALCQTSKFELVPQGAVNEAVSPRWIWFSAFGWLCGRALRRLGFKQLVQRIKDSQFVMNLFFTALSEDDTSLRLSEESRKVLEASYVECRSIVENASEQMGEGIYFRKFSPADLGRERGH